MPTYEIQEEIDDIENNLWTSIYESLDATINKQTPRQKQWKWFWTAELQNISEKREKVYRKWKRATGINKAKYWKEHLDLADEVRKKIRSEKNKHFRNFCNTLNSTEFSKATNKIKNIKSNKGIRVAFENLDGPQDAVDKLTLNWKNTFNGNIRNTQIENLTLDHAPPSGGYTQVPPFTVETIIDAINRLPKNKAPGVDHLKAEMFQPITETIAPIL